MTATTLGQAWGGGNGDHTVVLPGETIGILGGGQLGRMSAMAAQRMGYRVAVFTPEADSPCAQVGARPWVAPYGDSRALQAFAQQVKVATYEFENVPAQSVAAVEAHTVCRPSSGILHICQHRWREKTALRRLGIPTAEFAPVSSAEDLQAAVDRLGYPCVLKTTRGGYDGKGQWVLSGPEHLREVCESLFPQALQEPGPRSPEGWSTGDEDGEPPLILEAFVRFQREISVIVARNPQGECRTFPVAENWHRNNILHRTLSPARLSAAQEEAARTVAVRIAEGLNLVGLLAVEMFATEDGLLVNELAPRPHNSGHHTLESCVTSQFEQHIRAVCGLPLGSTQQVQAAAMLNLLGQHMAAVTAVLGTLLRRPRLKLHLYGKAEARPNRKMGHLTVLADTAEEALAEAEEVWKLIESRS